MRHGCIETLDGLTLNASIVKLATQIDNIKLTYNPHTELHVPYKKGYKNWTVQNRLPTLKSPLRVPDPIEIGACASLGATITTPLGRWCFQLQPSSAPAAHCAAITQWKGVSIVGADQPCGTTR